MKFEHSQIIRYGSGEDSIMMIQNIILRHVSDGHAHYYGINKFGQQVSASERHCSEATREEQNAYIRQRRGLL